MVTSALNHKKQSSPEEPSVDPLADDDVGEEQLIICKTGSSEAVLNGSDLVLHHIGDLTITNSIPKALQFTQ